MKSDIMAVLAILRGLRGLGLMCLAASGVACQAGSDVGRNSDEQQGGAILLRYGRVGANTQVYRLNERRGGLEPAEVWSSDTPVVRWGSAGKWAVVAPTLDRDPDELAMVPAEDFVLVDATSVTHDPQQGNPKQAFRASTIGSCSTNHIQGFRVSKFGNAAIDPLHVRSRGSIAGYLMVELGVDEVGFVPSTCVVTEGPWIIDSFEPTETESRGFLGDHLLSSIHGYGAAGRGPNTSDVCSVPPARPKRFNVTERDPFEFIKELLAKIPPDIRSRMDAHWQQVLLTTEEGKHFHGQARAMAVDLSRLAALQPSTKSHTVKKTLLQLQHLGFERTLGDVLLLLNHAGRALQADDPSAPAYRFFVHRHYEIGEHSVKYFYIAAFDVQQSLYEQFRRPDPFQSADASLSESFDYYLKLDVARLLDGMADKLERLGEQYTVGRDVSQATVLRRSYSWFKDPDWIQPFIDEMHAAFATRPMSASYELKQRDNVHIRDGLAVEFYLVPGTRDQRRQSYARYVWNRFLERLVVLRYNIYLSFGDRSIIARAEELIPLVQSEADRMHPGLSQYLSFERVDGDDSRLLLHLDLDRLAMDGLAGVINKRSDEQLLSDASMTWQKLLAQAKRNKGWDLFAGAITVGDMDIFLGLLRQLADETDPGLGAQVDMCWYESRHAYRIWVNAPHPDLSALP